MNDLIYDKLKLEYETTGIELEDLLNKYEFTEKDLKGCKSWEKNVLFPKTPKEKNKHINTHIDVIANNIDKVKTSDDMLLVPDPDSEAHFAPLIKEDLTKKKAVDIITQASQDIQNGEDAVIPKQLSDGFDGLRKLDIKMQMQATKLISSIDVTLDALDKDDAKGLKALVEAHTALRNSYFNSKNTMVNIINGDVTQNNTENSLQAFLAEVEDDC